MNEVKEMIKCSYCGRSHKKLKAVNKRRSSLKINDFRTPPSSKDGSDFFMLPKHLLPLHLINAFTHKSPEKDPTTSSPTP
jgi:hypothetical protein